MIVDLTSIRLRLLAAACAAAISVTVGAATAMGAGGASGSSGGSSGAASGDEKAKDAQQQDMTTCEKSKVWDAKHKKCVVKHSGVLPDDELTDYAFSLAKADRYDEAIEVLDMLQDPNTPKAWNYRGYATRKLGRTDEGISYYLKAVALDPAYAQVREYLGEAYVIKGKLDLAQDQLTTIQKLCGTTECEEYEDLSDAIKKAQGL
jgi:Flp pilus assembly protein TadD